MKVYRFPKGFLVHGDCLKALKKVKSRSVDLVFADPPFNIGFNYDEYSDTVKRSDYLAWVQKWMTQLARVLKRNGSIFVAIGDEYASEYRVIMDRTFGLENRRNWIVWHYTFGVYCKGKFGRDHAHIFYYTRDPKRFTFNADEILVPSARQTKYNDKRAEAKGRVPGDVWNFPRVCGTFKERLGHPCQMPEALLERIVKVASNKNEVVLDPFGGSGTTAAVAQRLKRKFITCEKSKAYSRIIASRLKKGAKILSESRNAL